MKTTKYFQSTRSRPDRVIIEDEWIVRALLNPDDESIQEDGRIRRWIQIPEMGNRFLRIIVLSDGETVHNAFIDRGYKP